MERRFKKGGEDVRKKELLGGYTRKFKHEKEVVK
jgi:hypothetical protein